MDQELKQPPPTIAVKTRDEAARYVEAQFDIYGGINTTKNKGNRHHYGKQEVRDLLDFIYGGEPTCDRDCVHAYQLKNRKRHE